jgi:hypothetical protein
MERRENSIVREREEGKHKIAARCNSFIHTTSKKKVCQEEEEEEAKYLSIKCSPFISSHLFQNDVRND